MHPEAFTFWVSLPPCTEDLTLLEEGARLADPLIDLRYGSPGYRRTVIREAVQRGLSSLTVFVDFRDADMLEVLRETLAPGSRMIFSDASLSGDQAKLLVEDLCKRGIETAFEVDSAAGAKLAADAGADFIVASANEAGGAVSPKSALVLIQELMDATDKPLVIRGGLGPQGAAGAVAAGCGGCILDSQILLVPESPLSEAWREVLLNVSPLETEVVGAMVNRPYRVLSARGRDALGALREREKAIFLGDGSPAEKTAAFEEAIQPILACGFAEDGELPPVGQSLAFAQQFAADGLGVRDVIELYRKALSESIERIRNAFPLVEDSPLAKAHGVELPLVQGPMGGISADARLPERVSAHGGLPFVAAGGSDGRETRRLIAETRKVLGDRSFGVGLIAFSPAERIEEQIEAVAAERPPFALIAGGDPALAQRLEQAGVGVYLHAPSPAHLKDFLDCDVRGVVLEGQEAGGHVGKLGSLVLWELAVREILGRRRESVSDLRVLLAGGIATGRGALCAATLASPLVDHGVAFGLQIGTAYLMTREAVTCGAVPPHYQQSLLEGGETVIAGETVNLRARLLDTPAARDIIRAELEWEDGGAPIAERRERFDRLKTEALRKAAETAGDGSSDGCEVAYMCGEAISFQSRPRTISELHEELTAGARRLAEALPHPPPRGSVQDDIPDDAVAIVGIGCIFPGANDPDEYWDNMVQRRSAIREVPKERWDADLYYDPAPDAEDKSSSRLGAFIEGFEKDPIKFRIPPVAAASIDRVQFLALEVTHQALADAGYLERGFPRAETAVIVGHSGANELGRLYFLRANAPEFIQALQSAEEFRALPEDVQASLARGTERAIKQRYPALTEDSCGGVFGSIVAGRIANCFDLGGSGLTVDGACAASLAAVATAVAGLQDRRYDLVLAGGIDTRLDATTYIFFSSLGALSDRGSFPFDERADGFVLGEGAGMVVLKRYSEARRDGDKIYAVIRGVGSSSDGRAKAITAPDVRGQIRAIERAYEGVPFTPAEISLVEAHGTGTVVGDRTEIASLGEVFGRYVKRGRSVGLGSVKSMIGHLKAASGIAGLIKVALALDRRVLPPTINCERPRRDVDWENSPLYLITEATPWTAGRGPRRAAVESFGFGGVNYHMILEEAPRAGERTVASGAATTQHIELPAELLIFRSKTPEAILKSVAAVSEEIAGAGDADLRSIALRLQDSGSSGGAALAVVASDPEDCLTKLRKAESILSDDTRTDYTSAAGIYYSRTPLAAGEKVAFLFPGQGAQYVNMAGDLAKCFPFAGEILQKVDGIVRAVIGQSMLDTILCGDELDEEERREREQLLLRTDYNHPALLGMAVAIGEVLRCAGVEPDMTAGHSLGEYAALHAAGVFDMQTAIVLTTARGCRIYEHSYQSGAMASVAAPDEQVGEILAKVSGFVTISNRNCPAQTVISGDVEAVDEAIERFGEAGIQSRRLPVSSGFHSPLLASSVEPFRRSLEKAQIRPPVLPVQSNLAGRSHDADGDFAVHLRDTMAKHMVRPVEFIRNVESMYADGARVFLEIGPGSTLCSFVDNILGERPHWAFPTNVARRSASLQLLHALGFCSARGLPVNLRGIISSRRRAPSVGARPRTSRPARSPAALVKKDGEGDGLLRDALPGADRPTIRRYLRRRGEFLKSLISLDFQHFTDGHPTEEAGEKTGEDLESRVVQLVSAKTGYPPEVIDLDLDVEAELGLDSIKQVEIVRSLEEALGVRLPREGRSQRQRVATLGELVERFRKALGGKPPEARGEGQGREKPAAPHREPPDAVAHRWVCETVQAPLVGEADPHALANRRVVILADVGDVGGSLAKELSGASGSVSVVRPSDGPGMLPDEIDVLVDLSSAFENERPGIEEMDLWWERAERRADLLLAAARKLVGSPREDGKALWVEITTLGGRLGEREIAMSAPLGGIGLAISRCLFSEHPDVLDVLYVDFDPDEPVDQIANHIRAELTHTRSHREIGYTDGKRFEIHWRIDDAGPGQRDLPLDSQGVVLAVGGARGVTAGICRKLAEQTHAKFIVVGKSPTPPTVEASSASVPTFAEARDAILTERRAEGERIVPAEIDRLAWDRVWAAERARNMAFLRAEGSEVVYHQCDLTDADAVRRLVAEIESECGRIDVVIQGAGALVEKSIVEFETDRFVAAMKTKALGTAILVGALENIEVGVFVNIASIVGRWGYQGLSAYAAGHEIASILVGAARGERAGRWMTLFYGPWTDVGMTRLGSTMDRLRKRGSAFMSEEEGATFCLNELAAGDNYSVAFRGGEHAGLFVGAEDAPGETRERHPLLDEAVRTGSETAEGSKTFDPARDRYIAEHVIAGEPLLPGLVSLEVMAQTASLLADPGRDVTVIEEVSFPRSVRFPRSAPRKLHTRARTLSSDDEGEWFAAELYSIFNPPGGGETQEVIHASCRIRFGQRPPPEKPSLLLVSAGFGDARVDLRPVLESELNSGRSGMFHNVRWVSSLTQDGIVGMVLAPRIPELGDRPLIDNPIRLDGFSFLSDVHTAIVGGNFSHYADRIERITFFASDDPEEARLVRIRLLDRSEKRANYDIEAVDSMGRVTERMTAKHSIAARPGDARNPSEQIWRDLRENPQLVRIGELLGSVGPIALMHLSIDLLRGAMETDERGRILSEELCEAEAAHFAEIRRPKRRMEWLGGRLTAKAAVRFLLWLDAPPSGDIEILSRADGAPFAQIAGDGARSLPHISIAHSGGMAVAGACEAGPIGVDVEEIAPSIQEIADEFCSPAEVQCLESCPAVTEVVALTSIWAAKEAARKAVGAYACSMKDLILQSAAVDGPYIVCELTAPMGRITAVTLQSSEYVYAVSLAPRAGGGEDT